MSQANLSQIVLLAYAFRQQAQDTGRPVEQLVDEWFSQVTREEALAFQYDWESWARPDQLPPPGDWTVWLILGGRGSGKTRPGAEFILQKEREGCRRMALVAETENDGRKIMVEGKSGILACASPDNRPEYHPENRELIWPSGARADLYSGDSPGQLRGPQHDAAWLDELAKWKYPEEALANLEFALRLEENPQYVITTTPRPLAILMALMEDPGCVTVQESTYANRAHLPKKFIQRTEQRYGGTRLGRQEIDGQVLTDTPGALWTLETIDKTRVSKKGDCARIVVAVDPQGNEAPNMMRWLDDDDDGSETGIVVCGKDYEEHGYVIDDLSGNYNPDRWAQEAVAAYRRYGAGKIVAEINHGGEMVRQTIYAVDQNVPVEVVRASEGKKARAEPASVLYKNGKVSHVGTLAPLEDEMTTYTGKGKRSPNRLDALVWALTVLFLVDEKDSMPHFDPKKHESLPRKTRLRGESEEHWADRSAVYIPE